jgi:hypothetical protein
MPERHYSFTVGVLVDDPVVDSVHTLMGIVYAKYRANL